VSASSESDRIVSVGPNSYGGHAITEEALTKGAMYLRSPRPQFKSSRHSRDIADHGHDNDKAEQIEKGG
jgi:hypothetical protein